MAANRGFVVLVALAVLVWAVAFGGGLTVAVLTSNATVTTTFETVDEFTPIENTTDPAALRTSTVEDAPSGNETNGTDRSASEASPVNGSDPGEDAAAPSANGTVSGGNASEGGDAETNASDSTATESAPSSSGDQPSSSEDGSASSPENESTTPPEAGSASPPEQSTNSTQPSGNTTDSAAIEAAPPTRPTAVTGSDADGGTAS